MTSDERAAFLRDQVTCRVATVGMDGEPHVSPLWYVWDGSRFWLHSLVGTQRWINLTRNLKCAVVVDTGDGRYTELRGVEFRGTVEIIGEVPRVGKPIADLQPIELEFARRYASGKMQYDGRHAWLRLTPKREYTWDFRKIGVPE